MQRRVNFLRGSRKHILDWLELDPAHFRASLNQMVAGCGAQVGEGNTWMPSGQTSPREARLGSNHQGVLTKDIQRELTEWWLVHHSGANTPNWDLAAGASFNGRQGLVLVEAKAHEGELETAGKRPWKDKANKDKSRSEENHERIGIAIEEARKTLESMIPGICISRDRCYQLSNRIAFAWKLASLGIPVVLVYLDFLNDPGMRRPFADEGHFQKVMRGYLSKAFPNAFLDQPLDCGLASMHVIIRSRQARSPLRPPVRKDS